MIGNHTKIDSKYCTRYRRSVSRVGNEKIETADGDEAGSLAKGDAISDIKKVAEKSTVRICSPSCSHPIRSGSFTLNMNSNSISAKNT